MGKLVDLSNVTLDWETSPELAARSDLTAGFAGIGAAASRGTSR